MKAMEWYKIAAAAEVENYTALWPRKNNPGYSNSCHWAAFRLAWWKFHSPDESIRNSIVGTKYCRYDARVKHSWATELFQGIDQAQKGDFKAAEQIGNTALSKCAEEDKHFVTPLLEAWRAGKEYREEEGAQPLYLKLNDPIPFFRCFEDYLEPAWKAVY